MAKLERKNFKVFAENAPLEEMGQFGSAVATTKKNTKDIEEIQELEAWQQGWGGAVISNKNYPPMEEMNGALNVMSYQTAYTLQEGIPEWNKDTVYYIGSIVKTLIDNKVVLYQSLKNDNIGNVLDNSEYWERLSFGGGLEICDIGIALYVDETKGLRRYLNGQIVDINTNTQAFLNRLKEIQTTNPDYFTTEENWQAESTLNIDGCVYKFVLNYSGDNVVSVRLPKYPDYVEINAGGTLPVVGNGQQINMTNIADTSVNYPLRHTQIGSNVWGFNAGEARTYQAGLTIDPTKSGIETTLNQTKLKLRYFIQIATGSETENNIINEIELNNPYSLFDSKYSDHELNNLSWLKSEGQWNAKAVYPTAYDKLLKVYNGTETVEGLSVKLSTETYTDYDFVLNTVDETFRLPLLNGSEDLPSNTRIDFTEFPYTAPKNGLVYIYFSGANSDNRIFVNGNEFVYNQKAGSYFGCAFTVPVCRGDVVTYEGILGGDNRLYPYKGNGSLYYYVGETVQNANLIDAGRIGEQLATKTDMLQASGAGMPSDKYIDLTLGASGSTYTAPANGWFTLTKKGNQGEYGELFTLGTIIESSSVIGGNGSWVRVSIPCRKNQNIAAYYTASGDVVEFIFIYAEGSK